MPDDSYDIPDIPDVPGDDRGSGGRGGGSGGGGGPSGGRRRWPWLLAGVVLGVAGVLLVPRYAGPYLPDFLGADRVVIRGQVVATERQEERLLLTVDSEQGAILVTYRQRVDEIALLVAEGDSVVLRTREFRPFLEGPELVGVRKGRWGAPGARADTGGGAPRPPPRDADTVADTGAGAGTATPTDSAAEVDTPAVTDTAGTIQREP